MLHSFFFILNSKILFIRKSIHDMCNNRKVIYFKNTIINPKINLIKNEYKIFFNFNFTNKHNRITKQIIHQISKTKYILFSFAIYLLTSEIISSLIKTVIAVTIIFIIIRKIGISSNILTYFTLYLYSFKIKNIINKIKKFNI